MAFRTNRDTAGSGPNPGLTPIDDVHGNSPTIGTEPDHTTGRIAGQDEEEDRSAREKQGKRAKKSSGKG